MGAHTGARWTRRQAGSRGGCPVGSMRALWVGCVRFVPFRPPVQQPGCADSFERIAHCFRASSGTASATATARGRTRRRRARQGRRNRTRSRRARRCAEGAGPSWRRPPRFGLARRSWRRMPMAVNHPPPRRATAAQTVAGASPPPGHSDGVEYALAPSRPPAPCLLPARTHAIVIRHARAHTSRRHTQALTYTADTHRLGLARTHAHAWPRLRARSQVRRTQRRDAAVDRSAARPSRHGAQWESPRRASPVAPRCSLPAALLCGAVRCRAAPYPSLCRS